MLRHRLRPFRWKVTLTGKSLSCYCYHQGGSQHCASHSMPVQNKAVQPAKMQVASDTRMAEELEEVSLLCSDLTSTKVIEQFATTTAATTTSSKVGRSQGPIEVPTPCGPGSQSPVCSAWHCRICSAPACIEPTATICCGKLFCHRYVVPCSSELTY